MKENILNNNILQDNNNNPITNISSNFQMINTYQQQNLQNPTLESLVQESPDPRLYKESIQIDNRKKQNYNNYINNDNISNNIHETSVAQQADIILKTYQSEQRVFRLNSNIQSEGKY